MRTGIARSLGLTAQRFEIEPEITAGLLRHGHRIHKLPVHFDARARTDGKKIGWRDGVHALGMFIAERFRRKPPCWGFWAQFSSPASDGNVRRRRF